MRKPNWRKIYDAYWPEHTCPMSRHVKVISESMRDRKGEFREALAGYDPDHMAEGLEGTVIDLWEARKLLSDLGYERVLIGKHYEWRQK